MAEASRPPRLAVIVSNGITGDSRVQKTALAAAHAGWEVLLIGRSSTPKRQFSWFGPVRVLRVPVGTEMKDREALRRRRTLRARITQAGATDEAAAERMRAAYESRARRRSERLARTLGPDGRPERRARWLAGKAWRRLTADLFTIRARAYDWEERHRGDLDRVTGDWRRDWPQLLDLDLAFGPAIEAFEPDVIHANDITMIHVGATVAGRMRAAGRRVVWVYDAHEYVAGVDWPYPRMMSAYPALEREFIGQADAVVTVSPEIAEVIRDENALERTPLVVRNTPVRASIGSSSASVRDAAGLEPDVPLMVYSGYIHHERGISTAVRALPELPGVHLAIVSGQKNAELRAILRLADDLGVRDRLHVVPYVAQHEVVDNLSSADLGVICSKKTINYELSLPTKLAEYLHAGLPVVVSDVRTLSAFVRDNGVGGVFVSEDPASFAAAARGVLDRRAEYAAAIDESVVEPLTWEHQSHDLLDLYARLHGSAPEPLTSAATWEVLERPRNPRGETAPESTWRPLGDTPIRLGMGPANFAGQLGAIARAVTAARADVSAEVFERDIGSPFAYPADVVIPARRLRRLEGQVEQLNRILPRYTHLLADAFQPVFGTLNGTDIAGDLPALREHGIHTALLSHGSDLRDPARHRDSSPYSLFHHAPEEVFRERAAQARRSREIADSAGLDVFVTTPDLLDDLPTATWLPLIVDPDLWASDHPVMERARPRVLHAPSKRWTKGTDCFAARLEEMDRRGLIEFQLIEGLSWSRIRQLVQEADLVLDQFAIGSYGTLACEAMAAGRPVATWLSEPVLARLDPDVPIIGTAPDQVVATVERLLDDPAEAVAAGRASVDYVRRVHDGRETVERLSGFLRR